MLASILNFRFLETGVVPQLIDEAAMDKFKVMGINIFDLNMAPVKSDNINVVVHRVIKEDPPVVPEVNIEIVSKNEEPEVSYNLDVKVENI